MKPCRGQGFISLKPQEFEGLCVLEVLVHNARKDVALIRAKIEFLHFSLVGREVYRIQVDPENIRCQG